MTILSAPTFLAANVDSCYLYRVQLSNSDADSVMVEVRTPSGSLHSTFALYDDGGSYSARPPDYACSASGDIIPNDKLFTRRINARQLADSVTGAYQFIFRTSGVDDQTVTVHMENVEACLITLASPFGVLSECFNPMTLHMRASRSEGDAVDSVWLEATNNDPTYHLNLPSFAAVSSDTLWTATFTPACTRCLPTGGPYDFLYHVRTRFGMTCSQSVSIESFVNSVPSVSNSTLPDTAYRPAVDSSLIVVTVHLTDCELEGATDFFGLGNLPGVKFDVHRDSNAWTPHNQYYFLRDDGTSPDSHAGDGTYSSWLVIKPDSNLTNNMYYFRFYAVDCAAPNDTSAFLLDSIRIIQSSGPASIAGDGIRMSGSTFPVLD